MAASKRVGFAVVGLGHIAERAVLPAFSRSRKTRLVALVSGDERKARRLAERFGADDYYNYDDFALCLSHPRVQAVYIATPNALHAGFSENAAAAGKHVLCEKPLATSVEDAQRIIEACRAGGVRLMVAYRKYYEPASVALKKLVESGKLGRLKLIHSAFTIFLPPGRKSPAWHLDSKLAGGGSLVDVGVYCVNTGRWLARREPTEAMAYAWTVDPERFREVEENIAFRLKFPQGLVLEGSASFGAAQASFLHIHGERGWAALDPAFAYDEERRLFGKIGGRWFEKKFVAMDEFALELDAFADCIRRRRDPEASGTEGLRDVIVMQAIYRSVRENRSVPINVGYYTPKA
jgi:predicted dehydrogenase